MKPVLLSLLPILLISTTSAAQIPAIQPQYKPQVFARQEVMIPMRDGARLQTVIFTPKQAREGLPFLIARTPYGVPENENTIADSGNYDELIADGYIFVFQNIRGRFKSEGQFVMNRPARNRNQTGFHRRGDRRIRHHRMVTEEHSQP